MFSLLFLLFIFLDQLTKFFVVKLLSAKKTLVLIDGFLKFSYIKNKGVSFGLLSENNLIIIILTVLIICYLVYELISNIKNSKIVFATSLIIGGAFGNLIDRLFRGYVVDFISFTILKKDMAIFNVADILITFGVIIYIIGIITEGEHGKSSSKGK